MHMLLLATHPAGDRGAVRAWTHFRCWCGARLVFQRQHPLGAACIALSSTPCHDSYTLCWQLAATSCPVTMPHTVARSKIDTGGFYKSHYIEGNAHQELPIQAPRLMPDVVVVCTATRG